MKRIIYYILSGCLLLGTGCSNWLDVKCFLLKMVLKIH